MKRFVTLVLMLTVVIFFALDTAGLAKTPQYIGVKKCKMCHNSKKSGAQYKIWAATPHAKAYETLASEEAKAIGKKMGIDDPQKSDKCLSCHVTGYGKDKAMFATSFKMEDGVQCEACHGPGSLYKSMKVMKDLYAGKLKPADYSLVMPTEKDCITCHNEKSPTFKGFDFKTYFAKIAHPVPKK